MNVCISQITTLRSTFAEDVTTFASAGWRAMEVWLTKLEDHLARTSAADTRKLMEENRLRPAAASFQGGLLTSEGEARRTHFDQLRKRLDLCEYFRIPTLLVEADFREMEEQAEVVHAVEALREAARWAAGAGVTLALEFLGRTRFCNNLRTALFFVEQCGEPNVGVNLDMFHFQIGPSKIEDLALLTPGNLAHVQFCDLSGVLRELATDADRVLPGDGELNFEPIVTRLRQIGYQGWVSLELMNPVLWRSAPAQVADLGRKAMERVVGSSSAIEAAG